MPDCKSCKENRAKNIKTPESVPYLVHEGAMARNERAVKRLVIALILAILMIFASNGIWLYCWMQYDYVGEEQIIEAQQDGESVNIVGGGDIDYGSSSENNNEQEGTP
jgi:hypothetical protein